MNLNFSAKIQMSYDFQFRRENSKKYLNVNFGAKIQIVYEFQFQRENSKICNFNFAAKIQIIIGKGVPEIYEIDLTLSQINRLLTNLRGYLLISHSIRSSKVLYS